MITALDHLVLLCPDITEGEHTYSQLLGVPPSWRSAGAGQASVLFRLGNMALELIAPQGEDETAAKLRKMTEGGAILTTLVYQTDDLAGDHHLMTRRGLSPQEIQPGQSQERDSSALRHWQSFRLPDAKMAGVKSFVLQPEQQDWAYTQPEGTGQVTQLDHLVINTPNPDRTVATYGARLGLRLALDRTATQSQTRFLFFKVGDLTLEIIHRLDAEADPEADDTIWGITWQTETLEDAHKRLSEAGVTVSEIRTGRKPGSHVFTVKSDTLDVPTLFIQHER